MSVSLRLRRGGECCTCLYLNSQQDWLPPVSTKCTSIFLGSVVSVPLDIFQVLEFSPWQKRRQLWGMVRMGLYPRLLVWSDA